MSIVCVVRVSHTLFLFLCFQNCFAFVYSRVQSFPTLLLFSHGDVYKFRGGRKLDILMNYAKVFDTDGQTIYCPCFYVVVCCPQTSLVHMELDLLTCRTAVVTALP